jgi:hypothetical protein
LSLFLCFTFGWWYYWCWERDKIYIYRMIWRKISTVHLPPRIGDALNTRSFYNCNCNELGSQKPRFPTIVTNTNTCWLQNVWCDLWWAQNDRTTGTAPLLPIRHTVPHFFLDRAHRRQVFPAWKISYHLQITHNATRIVQIDNLQPQ